ncbi:conserved protein of unknown function [Pseudomonas marincola]|uniref:Uncharacterized protein n=1 Tax=Pseudomonas marincola TaxID=437900 RepID=A0A653E6L4_9PSED|nr:conserved protein of unknown function [Pseudomonas marincola]
MPAENRSSPAQARANPLKTRKHLKICEKFCSGGSPNANKLLLFAPLWEDAGVAERDGFEIRCISDGT